MSLELDLENKQDILDLNNSIYDELNDAKKGSVN